MSRLKNPAIYWIILQKKSTKFYQFLNSFKRTRDLTSKYFHFLLVYIRIFRLSLHSTSSSPQSTHGIFNIGKLIFELREFGLNSNLFFDWFFFLLLWCERKFMRIVWRRRRNVRSFDLISYWLLLCMRKCEKSSSWCDNLLIQKWIKRSFSCVAFDELFYLLIVYWFFFGKHQSAHWNVSA